MIRADIDILTACEPACSVAKIPVDLSADVECGVRDKREIVAGNVSTELIDKGIKLCVSIPEPGENIEAIRDSRR